MDQDPQVGGGQVIRIRFQLMMKAELTAENRPAYDAPTDSAVSTGDGNQTTDEDKGRVQVLVVLFRVIAIELPRFSAVYSEEVGSGILGPQ